MSGVNFIKPFAPRPSAKCAGNNVFCFIKNNSTLCGSPRAYLRHTPHAMRPTFMKEFLSIALCASYFCAMGSAPKKSSLFASRPKLNLRHAPNFYEIDPRIGIRHPKLDSQIRETSEIGLFIDQHSNGPLSYISVKNQTQGPVLGLI